MNIFFVDRGKISSIWFTSVNTAVLVTSKPLAFEKFPFVCQILKWNQFSASVLTFTFMTAGDTDELLYHGHCGVILFRKSVETRRSKVCAWLMRWERIMLEYCIPGTKKFIWVLFKVTYLVGNICKKATALWRYFAMYTYFWKVPCNALKRAASLQHISKTILFIPISNIWSSF